MAADLTGFPFMQLHEFCVHCQEDHFVDTWMVFVPKIGPLRKEFAHRGSYLVKFEDINNLTQSVADEKLKKLPISVVEYGACIQCSPDPNSHFDSEREFCDFGIISPYQSNETPPPSPPPQDMPEGLFLDRNLTHLTGYIGSLVIEARLVQESDLEPIVE